MKILGFAGVALLVAAGTASAGPTTRFGLTLAASDQAAPGQTEIGPMIALGERVGPFTVEADYAYLSFMDWHTGDNGMQRLGLNVRADVFTVKADHCRRYFACTRGSSLYVEGGVAERYGQWHLDYNTVSPANSDRAKEVHLGVGIELDNRLVPYRYGWQFGLRFAMTPHDSNMMDPSCLTTSCSSAPASATSNSGAVDKAVLVEWTFLVGS